MTNITSVHITSSLSVQQVADAVEQSLRTVGGNVQRLNNNTIQITNVPGGNGIANISAHANVNRRSDSSYLVECVVQKKPTGLFWVCFIVGFFFLWFLWIANIYYLFMNPASDIQNALNQVPMRVKDYELVKVPPAQSAPSQPIDDPLQNLSKLKAMLDAKLISSEEYEAKKSELLKKL